MTDDPERTLQISYAPAHARAAIGALFALDDALATLLRTTTEPAIAQIRLAWWRERLAALDGEAPPPMPVLEAVARDIQPLGVGGGELVVLVEGWEVLIEAERLDHDALHAYAAGRGGRLFRIAARLVGQEVEEGHVLSGEGWALSDLSRHLTLAREVGLARRLAGDALAHFPPWPRPVRMLGAMAAIARMDLALSADAPLPLGAPARVGRMAWMRMTGR